MWNVLLDALIDSLKVFPFIFLVYIIMEFIENADKKKSITKLLQGKAAPVVASGVGLFPQCGFSVMCAKLYDNGLIKTGTILSVFLATSDEGLVILISNGAPFLTIFALLIVKFAYAIIVGTVVNFILRKREILTSENKVGDCIECEAEHFSDLQKYFLHPLFHTVKVFLYVFVINVAFGFLIYGIGEDKINAFLSQQKIVQIFVSALIGFIPNCASSVILSQAFLNGMLTFSALIAGLSANAGLGFAVILKNKKRIKNNLILLSCSLFLSIALGLVCHLFETIF